MVYLAQNVPESAWTEMPLAWKESVIAQGRHKLFTGTMIPAGEP